MNRITVLFVLIVMNIATACQHNDSGRASAVCSPKCLAKNSSTELTCKLMPEELRRRKETILQRLKEKVVDRKELENGYAFKFPGSDAMVDELVEFIKTERQCCDFFIFNLSISGDKSEAWLELTGVEGSKDFVTEELGL